MKISVGLWVRFAVATPLASLGLFLCKLAAFIVGVKDITYEDK